MMKLNGITALAAAASLCAAQTSFAQVTEDSMGKVVPVELFVCDFRDGKGQGDLEAATVAWNAFMDDRNYNNYSAWQLTPYYYGAGQDFDMIWMGAATDGNAMGSGTHDYLTEGGDVAAGFAEVLDCRAHIGLSSAMYQSPPDNNTPASGVMTMSDCSMNEGTRYSDVQAAEVKWAKYRKENGSKAGMYHWYPSFGGGDQSFDYKIVYAYPDFKSLGADWEVIANGGGRETSEALFADLDDCDDSRVYIARSIRAANLRK